MLAGTLNSFNNLNNPTHSDIGESTTFATEITETENADSRHRDSEEGPALGCAACAWEMGLLYNDEILFYSIIENEFKSCCSKSLPDSTYSRKMSSATQHYLISG